jgi:hypothetical protein
MSFPDPNAITAIKSSLTVTQASATACSSSAAFTGPQAMLGGFFSNTGTPTPGSSLGDVFADAFLVHTPSDPGDLVRAQFVAFECQDDFCGTTTPVGFGDLGPVATGQTVTLSIQWDQPNHQFIFQRDANPPAFVAYSVSDASAPASLFKGLHLSHGVANCTTTPRPSAFMSVLFGSVFVNP